MERDYPIFIFAIFFSKSNTFTFMLVYTDTSVIGGCFDVEFEVWSNLLFKEFATGSKQMMLSDLTFQELEFAREEVKLKPRQIPDAFIRQVFVTDEAIKLAETYIHEGALTTKSYNDALHIATATIQRASVLASWNFKHIVNLNRIRLYNAINLKLGYPFIEIRTPREILYETNNES